MHEYFAAKSRAAALARAAAREITSQPVDVVVNAADGTREGTLYVRVTGTSAEAGDDGQAGRGNRVNGLITPYRPTTLEAASLRCDKAGPGRAATSARLTLIQRNAAGSRRAYGESL